MAMERRITVRRCRPQGNGECRVRVVDRPLGKGHISVGEFNGSMQHLPLINPMHYFLITVRGVFLEISGIEMLVAQYWPMGVIALFSLSAVGWLLCRRMY